jgi:hypothetical protein
MEPFRGGMKGWGESAFFWRKGRGGTPFFSQGIENIDILGYFVAQKVTKYSKNRSKQHFGVVLKCFKLL